MGLWGQLTLAAMSMAGIVAARYLLVSGGLAWVTNRRHPGLYAGRNRQIRREIGWSLVAAAIYGAPAGVTLYLWRQHGLTAIYSEPGDFPLVWIPLAALLYLLIQDSWFYWSHRAMHHPRLFRRMHRVHHASPDPTAWTSMAFHPLESLSSAWLIPALAFVIPIHWAALSTVLAVATVFGVTNHLGWDIFPKRWRDGWFGKLMITASHHHLHHRNYRSNYGLYFRLWDYVCGTDCGVAGDIDEKDRGRSRPAVDHDRVGASA